MTITEAYRDGYKAGNIDKFKGVKLQSLWDGGEDGEQFYSEYCRGYREGRTEGRQ
jgi:hypothetical protein